MQNFEFESKLSMKVWMLAPSYLSMMMMMGHHNFYTWLTHEMCEGISLANKDDDVEKGEICMSLPKMAAL